MRGKALSVLSLEGRYHTCFNTCAFITLFGPGFLTAGQKTISRDKKRYHGTYRFYVSLFITLIKAQVCDKYMLFTRWEVRTGKRFFLGLRPRAVFETTYSSSTDRPNW